MHRATSSAARPRLRLRLDRALTDADRADLADALLSLADAGLPLVEVDGVERYRIEGIGPTPALVATVAGWCAARGILALDLRTTGATLEERYLELVGEEGSDGEDGDGGAGADGAGAAGAGRADDEVAR